MEDLEKSMHQKVGEWLGHEGYPLEFRVAHRFREAGFRVFQGFQVFDDKLGKGREIDVLAVKSLEVGGTSLYSVCVVECKWSKSKPWVLFSSSEKDRGGSSLLAQLIASQLGEAVVHILAADKQLQNEQYFRATEKTTYGGRVAFSKSDSDFFYSTVQSIISKSVLVAKADDPETMSDFMPGFGSIVFPVIVVDSDLFKASYNAQTDNVDLEKREELRLRWSSRGATDHAISVVSFESLRTFVSNLSHTADELLKKSKPILEQLISCFAGATEYPEVPKANRGYSGEPELLLKLSALEQKRLEELEET